MRIFYVLWSICAPAQALNHLDPGGDLVLQQTVDVNVVTIGFPAVPPGVLASLPGFTGVPRGNATGIFMSQRFDFRYHVVQAPSWFEDAFFGALRASAAPQAPIQYIAGFPALPVSFGQFLYDFCNVDPSYDPTLGCSFNPLAPRVNRRFITQNYLLSAPGVERLLSQALGPALGVDVRRPTVVLINWWGRPDYVDHIYLDPSEPDPETHAPRGFFASNELAGYGGTAHDDPETCAGGSCVFHRLWFYDVSAGPMAFTGAEDLVSPTPRFIGFVPPVAPGQVDYRVHHIADYAPSTPGTYRPLNTQLGDLGKIVEVFVAGIAHAGPLYPPGLTPPRQPHHLVLDINRWTWDPATSFAGLLDVPRLIAKMDKLPYDVAAAITARTDTHDSKLGTVWDCSLTSGPPDIIGQSCYGNRNGGFAWADLYAYFTDHLFQFLQGAPDYEVPIFQFKVPQDLAQFFAGWSDSNLVGLSVINAIPGLKQTFIFTSTTAAYDSTHGHGALLEHEVGHHLGFSHPFHGFRCASDDCASFVVYGFPDTYYSLLGRNVSGIMTYVTVNNDYSQFELDNLRRWLTYEYLDLSNFIAGKIGASPRADRVQAALTQADGLAGTALAAYDVSGYDVSVESARSAYQTLLAAADSIHVQLSEQDWHAVRRNPADTNRTLRKIVDLVFDSAEAMSGTLSTAGVHGAEGLTLPPPTTPLAAQLNEPAF